jgi:lysophospholipase L1-like esterase
LLLLTCAHLALQASPGARLQLKDGDRIVLVGSTLIEREQRYGYWETGLTLLHPDLDLKFRNLGWSGDTVYGDSRAGFGTTADGYKLLKEQIFAAKPTVLVLAYGGNESFDGEAGLPRFREGMRRLLQDLTPLQARIILLAPMAAIKSTANANPNIPRYRKAIQEFAKEMQIAFGDPFALSSRESPAIARTRWTDDGIHLNAEGYRKTAPGFCSLFEGPTPGEQPLYKFSAQDEGDPHTFQSEAALIARSTEGRVIIDQLPSGELSYVLKLSEKSASSEKLSTLGTGSKEDWQRGIAVRFDVKGSQFELVRQAVIAKNVEYFNRYRPQNETYLFGFRKYEQGQNAAEVAQFDRQVAEAEARIASFRKPIKVEFILSSFARRSNLDKNR